MSVLKPFFIANAPHYIQYPNLKKFYMTKNYFPNFSFLILLVLTISVFSCNAQTKRLTNVKNIYKDELEHGTWIIDKILGLEPNTKTYHLTNFIERKFAGNLI